MSWRGLLLACFLMPWFATVGAAATATELRLTGQEERVPLEKLAQAFEDKSAALNIETVAGEADFAPRPQLLHPGFTRSAIWLKFDIANDAPQPLLRWLEVQPARLRQVSLFLHEDGHWHRIDAGAGLPFHQRPVAAANAVFPVPLQPDETRTIYLRVAGPQPLDIEPVLWDPLAFRTQESWKRLADGLMLGGLVVMSLLGVLLLFLFRHRLFLFNALATATYFLGEFSSKGYSLMHLWPEATDWVMRGLPLFALLGVGLNLLFLRDLLATRRNFPRIDRLLLLLLAAEWLPAIGILFGTAEIWERLSFPQHFPVTVIMALVGIYAAVKGVHAARYYTAAYLLLALGSLTHGLALAGVNIPAGLAHYALPIGMLLNNLFLLASAVDHINAVRREKVAAQAALLAERATHEAALEGTVAARTADLNAALIDARKAHQSQSRLLAYISHDLRAPLATIVNYTHLLARHGNGNNETSRRYQETIERSALHQLELIDDLVEYARGELDHLELAPVPTFLHDWLDTIAAQGELLAAQYDNRFRLDTSPELPPVLVFDPKRLRQILLNLLGNAAKFTRDGEIRLAVHARPGDAGCIELAFAVEDSGAGMAQTDIERLFQPFERHPSATREGFGLGLAIARQLVRAMGGELTATSQLGQGSCFTFRLALDTADEADVMVPALPFALPEPFGTGKTVLVADDNPASREYLREVLATADFDVVCAADGTQALRLALDREFDAVLLDQAMPGLSGWEVLRALHTARGEATPPALLCSAMPPQRPDDTPEDCRFDATLLKPVRPEKLLETLHALGSRRTGTMARPTEERLATLRPLIDSGQISLIEDWAAALARDHPEFARFAAQVATAATNIDFAALEALTAPVAAHP